MPISKGDPLSLLERSAGAEGSVIRLSPAARAELLDPASWHDPLENYARSTKLGVALTDLDGALIGPCYNPQPVWSLARATAPAPDAGCPFCLSTLIPCAAAAEALRTGQPAITRDRAGLAHVAVPLLLGEERLGVLLAGQVFDQFPEQLLLDRLAREFELSAQTLWSLARRQPLISRKDLRVYGELLLTLGQSFLQARYGVVLERDRAAEVLALSEDVAEHKRLAAALSESEEKLRIAVSTAKLGSWSLDLATGTLHCMPICKANFGLPPDYQLTYERLFELIHPADRKLIREKVEQAINEGGDYEAEYRAIWQDGSVHWISARARAEYGIGGIPLRLVGMTLDITERKLSEVRIQESQRFLRSSLDALTSHIAVLDERGTILEVNEAWRRFADNNGGIGGAYGVGANYLNVCESGVGDCLVEEHPGEGIHAVLGGEKCLFELEYPCHAPDEQRWFLMRVTRFNSPGPVRVVVAHENITARKLAEEGVRTRNEHLRLLSEAAEHLLEATDADTLARGLFDRVRDHLNVDTFFNFMVNDAGDALNLVSCAGISEETARSIGQLEFGQAICGTVALRREASAATHIQNSDDPKVQLVKGFGIRAYICHPLMVGDELLGTLSFASRARDEFSEDEQEFVKTLCHYVAVAVERVRLISRLRDTDRRKDEFLATLAHELRNPLAPVGNALQAMKLAEGNVQIVEQMREMIERQVNALTRLVDDLLEVSRITRGKIELRPEPVELSTIVRSAVEISRPLIEAARHKLTVNLPDEPIQFEADPVRLAQVLSNLLNNAAKYTKENGKISLTAKREGDSLVIRVRDNGIGIAREALPHVFGLFVQVDETRDRAQGGLGIGLALVRAIAELHGGVVEALSEGLGKGSEVVLRLPAPAQTRAGVAEGKAPGVGAAVSGLRILVVDDNVDSADSMGLLLKFKGHQVRVEHDGPAAIDAARSFRPQVVFLDIGMPGMSGYDVARRLRELPGAQPAILIAITGYGRDEDRRRAIEAGFDHHLVKPVIPSELNSILNSLTLG
jgi:PAS domain S-box-containing protein